MVAAKNQGIVDLDDVAVLNSTAHALKFSGFQEMYFTQQFPPEFKIKPDTALINAPIYIHPQDLKKVPAPGQPLSGKALKEFVDRTAAEIAAILGLIKKT